MMIASRLPFFVCNWYASQPLAMGKEARIIGLATSAL
jgi:hypothetical protein